MTEPPTAAAPQSPAIRWIVVGLLLWGGYLALGAMRAPGNHAALRGGIIFACTLAFVGLWLGALAYRRRA